MIHWYKKLLLFSILLTHLLVHLESVMYIIGKVNLKLLDKKKKFKPQWFVKMETIVEKIGWCSSLTLIRLPPSAMKK